MRLFTCCCTIAVMALFASLSSTASAQMGRRSFAPLSSAYSPPHSQSTYVSPNFSSPVYNGVNTYQSVQPNYYGTQRSYTSPTLATQRGQVVPNYSSQRYAVPTPANSPLPAYSQNYAAPAQSYTAPAYSTPKKS